MILSYGGSFQGRSHIDKNVPCQDSSYHGKISNDCVLLVVADGVGSAKHSEESSKIAVDTVVECIAETNLYSIDLLKEIYEKANNRIYDYAESKGNSVLDYDTTLSLALMFNDGHILWAHSGDGGIIAIKESGEYEAITKPQNGPDFISVIPLRGGSKYWEFGESEGPYASVLVMTDGILDIMQPGLLRLSDCSVYVPMVRYFGENAYSLSSDNIEEFAKSRLDFMNGSGCESVTDDRSLVVGIHENIKPKILEPSYYAEPDWEKLKLIWRKKAYPHLSSEDSEIDDIDPLKEPRQDNIQSTTGQDNLTNDSNSISSELTSDTDNFEKQSLNDDANVGSKIQNFSKKGKNMLSQIINRK